MYLLTKDAQLLFKDRQWLPIQYWAMSYVLVLAAKVLYSRKEYVSAVNMFRYPTGNDRTLLAKPFTPETQLDCFWLKQELRRTLGLGYLRYPEIALPHPHWSPPVLSPPIEIKKVPECLYQWLAYLPGYPGVSLVICYDYHLESTVLNVFPFIYLSTSFNIFCYL